MKEVNVLGTTYDIVENVKSSDDKILETAAAYCDHTTKTIVIGEFEKDVKSVKDEKNCMNKITRHELVHAFLYESGLANYSGDEAIVDWMAIQIPKMAECFNKLEVM